MGFRFRRSFSIIPGVRLNISKTGISTSVGRRGATINISKRGTRATAGLPGTGLSYSEQVSSRSSRGSGKWVFVIIVALIVLVSILGGR